MPHLNTRDGLSEILWWLLMILGVLLAIVGWARFAIA